MNNEQLLIYQKAANSVEGCSIATGFIRAEEPNVIPIQYDYKEGCKYIYRVDLTSNETIQADLDFNEEEYKAQSRKEYAKNQDGAKLLNDVENAWIERTARLLKEALLETYFELNKESIITKNIDHFDAWAQSVGGVSGIVHEDDEIYDKNEYSIEYLLDCSGNLYYFKVDLSSPKDIKDSLAFDKDDYVFLIEGTDIKGLYERAKLVVKEADELSEVSEILIDALVHAYNELKNDLLN